MSNNPKSDRVKELFITVLGSGYAPFASGSWGSLAAIILFAIPCAVVYQLSAATGVALTWLVDVVLLVPGIIVGSLVSIWWGEWAVERFECKDPKPFVLDEFAGQWLALLSLPAIASGSWLGFGVVLFGQLFLFRAFDVLKVPPAAQMERWPAGWGILCDDLMAGLYANVAGQIVWRYTPLAAALGLSGAGA